MKDTVNFSNVENRKDFLSVDMETAISSEGVVFNIGDIVKHEGDSENTPMPITKFSTDLESCDVIAHSGEFHGRISFLYF